MFLLAEESGAFVGHLYPILSVNIQLFFSSSQLLLKFVNVGNLHSVHECQPLLSENNCSGMKVDFYNVTLRRDLHTGHLSFGQHLMDKVVPRDVTTAGIDGVQQAHDERNDEEGPQPVPVHLAFLVSALFLL